MLQAYDYYDTTEQMITSKQSIGWGTTYKQSIGWGTRYKQRILGGALHINNISGVTLQKAKRDFLLNESINYGAFI